MHNTWRSRLVAAVVLFGVNALAADPGLTKTEVKLGATMPMTGPLGFYGEMTKGSRAFFSKINDEGGVHGRKINYVIEDDAYNPTKTVPATKKLVEQDKVFALYQAFGFPHTAVQKYLEQKKVPSLYLSDGSKTWESSPIAIRGMVPWADDGRTLGEYIVATYPGKKVGFLYENSNFGQEGLAGAKAAMKDKVTFGPEESYNPGAPNVDAQAQSLITANVDVIVALSVPPITVSAMKVAQQKQWKGKWVLSYVNGDPVLIMLGGATVEGAVSSSIFKLLTEKDPGIEEHKKLVEKYFPGTQVSLVTIYGQANAELMVETLKAAGANPTRDGLLKAAKNMKEFQCSLCMFPSTTTATDGTPFKKLRLVEVKGGQWVLK